MPCGRRSGGAPARMAEVEVPNPEELHERGEKSFSRRVALTEDVRSLTRDASRELERVGTVTDRVDDIAGAVGRIVGTLSGLTRAGQIVGMAVGLKKGIDVFVQRLRQGDNHE